MDTYYTCRDLLAGQNLGTLRSGEEKDMPHTHNLQVRGWNRNLSRVLPCISEASESGLAPESPDL